MVRLPRLRCAAAGSPGQKGDKLQHYTRRIQRQWKCHADEVALHPEVAHTGISMRLSHWPESPNPCHYDTA
eukprot:scaffold62838_cov77-Phaeocystis_antarctica.AAC.1